MATPQREIQRRWPRSLGRDLFDWPFSPMETWRNLFDEDEVKVEEFTEGDQVVVKAELPGVDPDRDVDISIVDGNLCIRAERKQETDVHERDYHRSEIRYGAFSRVLPLPPKAKEDEIKASYKDGILEVRAPLTKDGQTRSKIAITRS